MNVMFSIIIPVYNAENYLRLCLDSILLQNYDNFEVICINDGSVDNSELILDSYAKLYPNLVILKKTNNGASSARNIGISHAKGDYVLFLDSDDYYYHKDVLAKLNSILFKTDIDCVYFPGGCITACWSGAEKYKSKYYDNGWDCLLENCRKAKILVFGSIYSQCYKREVLSKYNLYFDEELVYAEDRLFVVKFFYYAKETVVYQEPLYCYNVHSGSLMTTNNIDLKIDNIKKCVELICEFCIQNRILDVNSIFIYANGMYVSSILEEYKYKRIVNYDRSILFLTSIGFSKRIQSSLLYIHPVIYMIYKEYASKILRFLKQQ